MLMATQDNQYDSFFKKLTRLFKSGPVVRRKVKSQDTVVASGNSVYSSAAQLFSKTISPTYTALTANSFNSSERLMRFQDFIEMEQMPEIATALNLYADESCAQDDKGRSFHIYSDNPKIQEILEDLFYNVLNVEFNMRPWARNLCKNGDWFAYVDVSPEYGVQGLIPIPVNEIDREENFDPADPAAVRFRWNTLGARVLENWEIVHMRLLGNDNYLPYGSSVLDGARRVWRQLILIEDAMLVYRIVRAPERRVIYIDVGNMPNEAIPAHIESVKNNFRTASVVDRATGRVDLRYGAMSVEEDYIMPVRGSTSATKIDTLAGGQNVAAVEDVQYIRRKLVTALGVPSAYLGYEELLGSKSTLAQVDIRFARTINVIQKTILSELNKLAIMHLFVHGFSGEDLINFALRLSNPSTVAEQQKLELWRAKFEIAGSPPEGMLDRDFVRTNILSLTEDQIAAIEEGRKKDRARDAELEKIGVGLETADGGMGGGGGGGGGFDFTNPTGGGGEELGGLGGGELGGAPPAGGEPGGGAAAPAGGEPGGEVNASVEDDEDEENILTDADDFAPPQFQLKELDRPISASSKVRRFSEAQSKAERKWRGNAIRRRRYKKKITTPTPTVKTATEDDPSDIKWLNNLSTAGVDKKPLAEGYYKPAFGSDMYKMLQKFCERHNWQIETADASTGNVLLSEDVNVDVTDE